MTQLNLVLTADRSMCTSCNQKALAQNNWNVRTVGVPKNTEPIVCSYTVEDLEIHLLEAVNSKDYAKASMLKSAIAMYSKNCKMFEDYVLNL